MEITIGGDYHESIIETGRNGHRLSIKKTQSYIEKLHALETELPKRIGYRDQNNIECEIKELKLKIEHWGTFESESDND